VQLIQSRKEQGISLFLGTVNFALREQSEFEHDFACLNDWAIC